MITVAITFQNKVLDKAIEYYNDDKILLTLSDIHSLKVKYGSYVMIEVSNNLYILSKAWPYSKLPKGSAILNKLWSPNFTIQNKKQLKILPLSKSIKNLICSELICTLCIKENNSTIRDDLCSSISFKEVIKSMLMNTLVIKDILLGLTYHAESVMLKIEHTVSPEFQSVSSEDSTYDDSIVYYYLVNEQTKIQLIQQSSEDTLVNAGLLNKTNSSSCGLLSQISHSREKECDLERLKTLISRSFVGYVDEVKTALETCFLGTSTDLSNSIANSEIDNRSDRNNKAYIWTQMNRLPKGLILYGPPGTGKTMLMYSLISSLGCHSIALSHSILLSSFEGEAEKSLQNIFQEAEAQAPCCIMIDNMDLLCTSRNNIHASQIQRRVVACLLTLIDGHVHNNQNNRVFIIGTTSKINDIDPAIRRAGRIDREIEIGVPASSDRQAILEHLLRKCSISLIECIDNKIYPIDDIIIKNVMKDLSGQAHGMVGSDLLQVVKEAYYITMKSVYDRKYHSLDDFINDVTHGINHNSPNNNIIDNDIITNLSNDFNDITLIEDQKPSINTELQGSVSNILSVSALKIALKRISPSALREVVIEVPAVKWTDIGGMHSVKQSLREVVELPLQQPHIFKSLGILPPKGVLLYGPPGCSKTLMAKALATESSMNFMAGYDNSDDNYLSLRGPELLSKWLGESEKAIQTLFRRARAAAPSIVFFDEIDALASKRGDVSAGVSDRVLSQLLTELDGVQGLQHVIVIAATNRPDMLDPALIRPGRIDRKIYVPPPDEESRKQILSLELTKMPLQQPLDDYTQLIQLTNTFSGAEIVAACSEAAMIAIEMHEETLSYQHILTAIQAIKPQITKEMLEFYRKCSEKL